MTTRVDHGPAGQQLAPLEDRQVQQHARLAGALLVVMAGAALFAEMGVRQALVVPGDALATAQQVAASPELFRWGLIGYLIAFLCDVPVTVLLYLVLRRVDRTTALIAAGFRLVYTAVVAGVLLQYAAAVPLLTGPATGAGADDQRAVEAMRHLDLFAQGFDLSLIFFGVHLVLIGVLLVRSAAVPRVLGALVGLGGLGYAADAVLLVVAPDVGAAVAPVLVTLAMSELVLAVWLVVKGVRSGRLRSLA